MALQNYEVREISYSLAMETVVKNHYLHRKCPCSHAYGLFEISNNTLKGVVVYLMQNVDMEIFNIFVEMDIKGLDAILAIDIEDLKHIRKVLKLIMGTYLDADI